jgi:hypothetical protein
MGSGGSIDYFRVNPDQTTNVDFTVGTPGTSAAIRIGRSDNIFCTVGLQLWRSSIADLSGNGGKELEAYAIGHMNDAGANIGSSSYQMDALVWKPMIRGVSSGPPRTLVNEMVAMIYNRQLTGNSSYGGIDPFASSTPGGSPWDGKYSKYENSGGANRYSYFGIYPTSNDGNPPSSRPVSSKGHWLRETWITGLYLNTPWLDIVGTGPAVPAEGLFHWEGTGEYIDLQIGWTNNYTTVVRFGLVPPPVATPVIQHEHYFPSSTSFNIDTGGVRVELAAKDWIYVPAGNNQATSIRFHYHIPINPGPGTNTGIYVRDDYYSTHYHNSQLDGYVTYVQHPRAI